MTIEYLASCLESLAIILALAWTIYQEIRHRTNHGTSKPTGLCRACQAEKKK